MIARLLLIFCLIPQLVLAAEADIALLEAKIDVSDKASLQRGARLYANYCFGCHSIKYVRYKDLARDIGIVDEEGEVLTDLVKQSLMFTGTKLTDQMLVSMLPEESQGWFGKAPPDLSLVSRLRGVDWLYTYLKTYYVDPEKSWGVNNIAYPDVGMPHVLAPLQGIQAPVGDNTPMSLADLKLVQKGEMSPEQYDKAILDLVNFLAYVGEPHQLARKQLGVWIILFLGILAVFSFLLKKEIWRDVH